MVDGKKGSGGARKGAGKRDNEVSRRYAKETKNRHNIMLYPSQKTNIEKLFGSVQKLLDQY